MTSAINPNDIDGAYPVAGQDNDSQGFRDNFTNTKTNFEYAADEITDLQTNAVLKAALTGTTLDNNMNGSLLYNFTAKQVSGTVNAIGTTSGVVTLNYENGSYQTLTTAGSVTLGFTNFPASGVAASIVLRITVASIAHTLTLPAAVSIGTSNLQGYVSNVITFSTTGTYILTLSPQTSTDTDIGWKYKSTYTSLEGRLFQSEITNEISYDTFYQTNMNLDPTRRQGIEGSIRQSITSNLEIQGFAAYRKSIFVSGDYAGNKLPMAPQNLYNLRASWSFRPTQTFSLGVSYVGDQQIAGDYSNTTKMPAYTVTDFFYRYQTKQWECQLAVRNVFNKEYYSYATDAYRAWKDFSTRYTALYPDMKRNLFLNFKYYLR